ncbi:hypothetical protein ACFCYN_20245 [Gottfriedia sp. NPDC056225]|uniref:hypothetical protein n=1 Tax=Gottfriedia sp. NPDC056225 TaxID=3345751 RepID=UPI001559952C|nr:hypothetical protein HPK19_25285 [Arthrobacter citreus]
MKIEVEFKDETIKKLEAYVSFYNINKKLLGTDKEITVEDTIKGSVMLYLNTLNLNSSPLIESKGLIIKSKIPSVYNRKSLSIINNETKIPKSTLSGILNGSLPSLENFIRIWLSIGQPSIHDLLDIEIR